MNNFKIENNEAEIKINKEIYTKEVIIQTTYVLLDKFYFLIDQDENNYIVYMKFKDENKNISENEINQFQDELIESTAYLDQVKRTSKIRETILEKALLSQTLDDETLEEFETHK